VLLVALPLAFGSVGSGTVIVHTQFGSVRGLLQQATLQGDNVTMNMIINDQVGDYPVTGTGTWIGIRTGQAVFGTIKNFTGKLMDKAFTGEADWSGTLRPSFDGNGTLTGMVKGVPASGAGLRIDGTWTTTFTTTLVTTILELPYANITTRHDT